MSNVSESSGLGGASNWDYNLNSLNEFREAQDSKDANPLMDSPLVEDPSFEGGASTLFKQEHSLRTGSSVYTEFLLENESDRMRYRKLQDSISTSAKLKICANKAKSDKQGFLFGVSSGRASMLSKKSDLRLDGHEEKKGLSWFLPCSCLCIGKKKDKVTQLNRVQGTYSKFFLGSVGLERSNKINIEAKENLGGSLLNKDFFNLSSPYANLKYDTINKTAVTSLNFEKNSNQDINENDFIDQRLRGFYAPLSGMFNFNLIRNDNFLYFPQEIVSIQKQNSFFNKQLALNQLDIYKNQGSNSIIEEDKPKDNFFSRLTKEKWGDPILGLGTLTWGNGFVEGQSSYLRLKNKTKDKPIPITSEILDQRRGTWLSVSYKKSLQNSTQIRGNNFGLKQNSSSVSSELGHSVNISKDELGKIKLDKKKKEKYHFKNLSETLSSNEGFLVTGNHSAFSFANTFGFSAYANPKATEFLKNANQKSVEKDLSSSVPSRLIYQYRQVGIDPPIILRGNIFYNNNENISVISSVSKVNDSFGDRNGQGNRNDDEKKKRNREEEISTEEESN